MNSKQAGQEWVAHCDETPELRSEWIGPNGEMWFAVYRMKRSTLLPGLPLPTEHPGVGQPRVEVAGKSVNVGKKLPLAMH